MNHSLHATRRGCRARYAFAGYQLCIEASDAWAARVFERFFAGWHLVPTNAETPSQTSFTIKAYTGRPTPSAPISRERFETNTGEHCDTDGQTYFLSSNSSAILVHPPASSCIEVWIGDTEADRSPSALARLVFNATGAALRRGGLFELHSGGVVEPETGAGVLLVGPSGSGKSTLTMQLAAAGWRYLSDDLLLLSAGDDGITARGLRRFFAATEHTMAASGLTAPLTMATTAGPCQPHKQRFEPEQLFPRGFAEVCVPRALFFMSIRPARESRCAELTPSTVMTRLLKMSPWACYDQPVAPQYLRVLARLAQQSVSFDLLAGRDLLDDPTCAQRLIASCVRKSVR